MKNLLSGGLVTKRRKLRIPQGLKNVHENSVVPPGLESFVPFFPALKRLRKKYLLYNSLTAAAKADTENTAVIAAVNRCATQNQVQHRVFPQAVKRWAKLGRPSGAGFMKLPL